MPTYVYQCPVCNERFERKQSFNDKPLEECPQGHPGVRRVFTPPPIIFKGSGWYITDSRGGKGPTNAPVPDKETKSDTDTSSTTTTTSSSDSTAASSTASSTETSGTKAAD